MIHKPKMVLEETLQRLKKKKFFKFLKQLKVPKHTMKVHSSPSSFNYHHNQLHIVEWIIRKQRGGNGKLCND
jgi:hypothetical protein